MSTQRMYMRHQNLAWKLFAYIVMVFFTFLTLGPLFWLAYSSFKPHQDIIRNVFAFPDSFFLENYSRAWELGNLGVYTLNSIFYAVIATAITVLFALSTGYGFAKFKYRKLSNFFYFFYMMGILITVHSVLVPLFILELKLGIDDTRIGVLLPYIAFGLPFQVYLATSYIKSIPDSMQEAAVIDGANYISIFWHVIMPMAAPVATTMIIFGFLGNWNEFVFVLTLTSRASIRTITVGLNSFVGGRTRDYGLQFAALVIGTIPMILFYTLFHEHLKRGFAAGSLKE